MIDVRCVPQQWELHQVSILRDQKQQTACIGKYSDSGWVVTDGRHEDFLNGQKSQHLNLMQHHPPDYEAVFDLIF
ncbi:hypothetical protein VZT92_013168 [Zoarces viviparus]|uniref:Uncharacterized protein n=1 Tax=Zoarces viviparus TaxID=48416 RepID=A0AAW1F375_ZOAVI